MRTLGIFLLSLLVCGSSAGSSESGRYSFPQDSLPRFSVFRAETTIVRGAILNGIPMVPFDAAIAAVGGSSFAIDSARTVDARLPAHTVRLIHRNPFVVISERATGLASLFQMTPPPQW